MSNRKPDLSGFDPFAKKGAGGHATSASSHQGQQHQSSAPPPPPNHQDASRVQLLEQQGFSSGLIRALMNRKDDHSIRIWVIDNSAAMATRDSHRIGPNFENVPASRWEELQECVAYHAHMAASFSLQTRFALLNDPGPLGPQYRYFTVGAEEKGPAGAAQELAVVKHVMTQHQPAGPTLLTEELRKLRDYIVPLTPHLQQNKSTVTIVLATQGIPTGGGPPFVQALRALEGLPVWVVVRLCTDDENVFEFYNSLDAQVNLPYDVLDDFFGESLEVYLRNPWLTYALPLHRFRELGFPYPVLDAIDERALTLQEVRDLCSLLFSAPYLPDPASSWPSFFEAISTAMSREKAQFNPVTRKMCPWINLQDLNRLYERQQVPLRQSFPQQQQQQQQPAWQQQQKSVPPQQQYNPQQSVPPQQQYSQQQSVPPQYQTQQPPRPATSFQNIPPASQLQQQQQQQQSRSGASPTEIVKHGVIEWAMLPPSHQVPRPIQHLLGTVDSVFPPSLGVQQHDYFNKWKLFSPDALSSGEQAVLKRAIRKTKFFLHPDKLPRDFDDKQSLLCRSIWDAVASASEASS